MSFNKDRPVARLFFFFFFGGGGGQIGQILGPFMITRGLSSERIEFGHFFFFFFLGGGGIRRPLTPPPPHHSGYGLQRHDSLIY